MASRIGDCIPCITEWRLDRLDQQANVKVRKPSKIRARKTRKYYSKISMVSASADILDWSLL